MIEPKVHSYVRGVVAVGICDPWRSTSAPTGLIGRDLTFGFVVGEVDHTAQHATTVKSVALFLPIILVIHIIVGHCSCTFGQAAIVAGAGSTAVLADQYASRAKVDRGNPHQVTAGSKGLARTALGKQIKTVAVRSLGGERCLFAPFQHAVIIAVAKKIDDYTRRAFFLGVHGAIVIHVKPDLVAKADARRCKTKVQRMVTSPRSTRGKDNDWVVARCGAAGIVDIDAIRVVRIGAKGRWNAVILFGQAEAVKRFIGQIIIRLVQANFVTAIGLKRTSEHANFIN